MLWKSPVKGQVDKQGVEKIKQAGAMLFDY